MNKHNALILACSLCFVAVLAHATSCPPTLTAADYRHLGDLAVNGGQYAVAASDYRQEAAIYERIGDKNAATIERMKADRWDTTIGVYAEVAPDRTALLGSYTGAKYEPLYGCYVGAYVGNDESLEPQGGDDRPEAYRFASRAQQLGALMGKPLATSWIYGRWGDPFPTAWARECLRLGMAPHIALEPDRGLGCHR